MADLSSATPGAGKCWTGIFTGLGASRPSGLHQVTRRSRRRGVESSAEKSGWRVDSRGRLWEGRLPGTALAASQAPGAAAAGYGRSARATSGPRPAWSRSLVLALAPPGTSVPSSPVFILLAPGELPRASAWGSLFSVPGVLGVSQCVN